MKPYYHDERAGIEIWHGDSREIIPLLTQHRFDLVLTDPPFGTEEMTGGYGRAQNYGGEGRKIAGDKDLEVASQVLALASAKIVDGYALAFCAARRMQEQFGLVPNGQYLGELIWDKGTPGLGYTIRYTHESALLWKIGEPKKPAQALLSVVRSQVGHQNAHLRHPHEKPIAFWTNALNLPGETVLEPFMGTGTLLWACKNLGRKCVGIEMEEAYCEEAARKLDQQCLPLAEPLKETDFKFSEQ